MKVEAYNFACPSCGAAQVYSIKDKVLLCEFCKTTTPITTDSHIDTHYLDEASSIESKKLEDKDITCKKCGASFQKPHYNIATKCPYCKTPALTPPTHTLGIDGILPFAITHKEAQKAFKKWVGSLWFAPTAFTKYLDGDNKLTGSYIPHFVYDTHTTTHYSGARGDAYYVTVNKTITDQNGNKKEVQVQERRIRWTPVSGIVDVDFKDITIPASKEVEFDVVDNLEKWDIPKSKSKELKYTSGFEAQEYTLSVDGCFKHAKEKMSPVIYSKIRQDIGGDEQQINTVSTKYISPRYKNILLPVWIASFKWNNKHYDYAVNGYNAKVSGERPYSVVKIVFAIVGVVGFVALLYFLSQNPTVQEFLSQFQSNTTTP